MPLPAYLQIQSDESVFEWLGEKKNIVEVFSIYQSRSYFGEYI